jgi:hypothetical protein
MRNGPKVDPLLVAPDKESLSFREIQEALSKNKIPAMTLPGHWRKVRSSRIQNRRRHSNGNKYVSVETRLAK